MSYETEFPDEYKVLLGQIEEYFTTSLVKRIKPNILLTSENGLDNNKLLDVGFSTNETQIVFTEPWISWRPKFTLKQFKVDFSTMSIPIAFSISDIIIEAKFDLTSRILGTNFSIQKGNIKFSFRNIELEGRIGFFIEEDSFMTTNYEMHYDIEEIETEIRDQKDERHDSKVIKNYYVPTAADLFTVEIRDRLDSALEKIIGEAVVDYSMGEMLVDEPEQVMAFEAKRIKIGKDIFDDYLAKVREAFKYNPDLAQGGVLHVNLQKDLHRICTVKSASSSLRKLDTLNSKTAVSFYEKDDEMVYYGFVEFAGLEYVFHDCEVVYTDGSRVSPATGKGDVVMDVQQNKLLMRVILPKKGGKKRVELEFVDFYQVRVDTDATTAKLDTVEWLADRLQPFLLGHVRYYCKMNMKKAVSILNAELSGD